jgi:hypothetical protein
MKTNTKRGFFKRWLDRHNGLRGEIVRYHKMAMMRTIFSLIAAMTGVLIFLKVFGFMFAPS